MNSKKLVLGVLAGILAGAAVATLYAPSKGSATRKKIARKSDDFVGAVETKLNDLLERITDRFWSAKNKVDRITENGKHQLEETMSKAGETLTTAKRRI